MSVAEGPELNPLTAARRELCRAVVELVQEGLGDPVQVRRLRGKVLRLKRKGAKTMAWKVLQRPVARIREPVITLNKNGILTWSPPIDAAMGEPARIEVLYDSHSQRLGIRAATGEDGIEVRRPKRLVAVKGMLQGEGIWKNLQLPLRQIPARLDEAGVWAISVRSTWRAGERRRQRDADEGSEL